MVVREKERDDHTLVLGSKKYSELEHFAVQRES
jgi:hypothetical protein